MWFDRKKKAATPADWNDLPTEVKILIVQGQTLVEETRKKAKEKGWDLDLTGKMQLKDDCACVETAIQKITKKNGPKEYRELELAVIRLQTSSDGLLRSKNN